MVVVTNDQSVGLGNGQRAEILGIEGDAVWVKLCGTGEYKTIRVADILQVELKDGGPVLFVSRDEGLKIKGGFFTCPSCLCSIEIGRHGTCRIAPKPDYSEKPAGNS